MKVIYQGDDNEIYDTQEEALLADVIYDSGIYLERYKVKEIAKALTDKLIFYSKVLVSPVITSSLQDAFNGTHNEEADLNDILDPNQ